MDCLLNWIPLRVEFLLKTEKNGHVRSNPLLKAHLGDVAGHKRVGFVCNSERDTLSETTEALRTVVTFVT